LHNIVIFASGAGTNAAAIIRHFEGTGIARVALVVCNKPGAGAFKVAADHGIEAMIINRADMASQPFIAKLEAVGTSLVILAGFLLKVPSALVSAYAGRMINLHPALLPLYGGKGMYGRYVHEAVLADRQKVSGITIHLVNEHYDEGAVLLQAYCLVAEQDTPDTLAARIHRLEHFYLPRAAEQLLSQLEEDDAAAI
jgi:phosphoribosylglycinamide formyltransferase-1